MTRRRGIAWLAGTAALYGGVVRPWLMSWGATDAEVEAQFPGADIVPGGRRAATMAVTVDAPPERVWPWLVQMGGERGGWYSWDRLDNAGRPSATVIHPEWQDLAVDDMVKAWSPVSRRFEDAWRVAVLEPGRFLGLHGLTDLRGRNLDPRRARPSAYVEGLWGFQVRATNDGRSRLVISGYQAFRPIWIERLVVSWLYIPVVWVMQARMLAVLKRNIERWPGEAPAPSYDRPRLPDPHGAPRP